MMKDKYLTRQTLLMRARNQNDQDAWGEFVEVYKRFIYHILHQMNIGENDFDDLVQEVLLRLWEKLATYDLEKARFRTWLSFVIRNIVLNYLNQQNRRNEKQQQLEHDPSSCLSDAAKPDLEKMIEREWKLHISNLAMEKIRTLFSGRAVDVFEMSLQGATQDEISEQLGIKRESVKVLKSRVRSRFVDEVKHLITELEGKSG